MLKKIPLPIVSVMLALAALGNLLAPYGAWIRTLCGTLSFIIGILVLIRIISYKDQFKKECQDPIMLSVFCCYSMALMILSTYLKDSMGNKGQFLYRIGFILHIILILIFTKRFMMPIEMEKTFASYYIVYVGIVAGSVASPAYGLTGLGKGIFRFGFIAFLILFVIISYRYKKYPKVADPAKNLFAITTAPAALCLTGYLQAFEEKNPSLVKFLLIFASILFVRVLTKMPKLLSQTFYPSMAAFTFPFVITAMGSKMATGFLTKAGFLTQGSFWAGLLKFAVGLEIVLAIVLTFYVLIRYIIFINGKKN